MEQASERCPSCRAAVSVRHRFCPACGTALGARSAERRKLATMLFCDVVGSTGTGERLDPEAVRDLMFRYFHEMRDALERRGGTVEKFIGDAVVAAFGVPVAHEDDALRAVRAAAAMRARLETLNGELEQRFAVRLRLRIGVNTGEVVAGDAASRETFATGDAVNVAARLQGAAAPGEILLGEQTYRLVRGRVDAVAVEPLRLKGKTEPVPAYRLVALSDDASRPAAASRLVGRSAELDRLENAFEAVARERRCGLVTVVGDPGVGKSRLAEELRLRLGERARTLWGRTLSYGDGITFWALGEALREAASIREEDSADAAVAKLAALAGADPDAGNIADTVGQALGLSRGSATADELSRAIGRVLHALAAERPLVLVFDDVHWAEPAFLDLLGQLDGRVDAPILLLCLARPELGEMRPDWDVAVELAPLDDDAQHELIRSLSGAGGAVEREVAAAAQGNPLFVEQLLAMLAEDGQRRPLELPASLSVLLTARLERLEEGERAAAERGSVEGLTFHSGALSALSEPAERAELGPTLRELARRQILEPDVAVFADEAAFRFRHVLIREAAYAAVPKRLRAELHERLADWLETKASGRLLRYEEILGYHLEQAYRYRGELGPPDEHARSLAGRAARLLGNGGRRAYERGDTHAAANLLERALALNPPASPERAELQLLAGSALVELGRLEAAMQLVEAAAASGDPRVEAHARLRLGFARMITDGASVHAELPQQVAHALAVGEELADDRLLALALYITGFGLFTKLRFAQASEAWERGLTHAGRAGARREEAQLLYLLGAAAYFGPKPVPEALPVWERRHEAYRPRPIAQAAAANALGCLLACRGRFDEARSLVHAGWEALSNLGWELHANGLSISLAQIEFMAGDPEAAAAILAPALEQWLEFGDRSFAGGAADALAEAAYRQGDLDEAERLTMLSEELSGGSDEQEELNWRSTRAKVLARRGEADAALALVDEVAMRLEGIEAPIVEGEKLLDRAEVFAALGRTADAFAAAEQALALFEQKGNLPFAAQARARRDALAAAAR